MTQRKRISRDREHAGAIANLSRPSFPRRRETRFGSIFRQDELPLVAVLPGAKRSPELPCLRRRLLAITMGRGCGRNLIVFSDEEKRELREMAASEKLREEFRMLRKNSRAIEGRVSVDELAHWLTVMNRICPGNSTRRKFIHDADMRF